LAIAAHADETAKGDRLPGATAGESIATKAAEMQPAELQPEAFINGVSTGLIGAFRLNADGSLSLAADELRGLGLIPDRRALAADGTIDLNRLPNVTYAYDEPAQAIRFTAGDRQRIARTAV
jgi:outer membrane usher protein